MRRVICALLAALMLTGCTLSDNSKIEKPNTDGIISGVWISYNELSMKDKNGGNAEQFTKKITEMLDNCAELGINTVFLQVRPFCDAMYRSELFPWSEYLTGKQGGAVDYDPLEIAVNEAHKRGISLHAWINPFRISFDTDKSKLSEDNPALELLNDKSNEGRVTEADGGLYFCPASTENHKLVIDGAREIIQNYDVDGIHIDDYFYPSTDESVDKAYYEKYKQEGGKQKLDEWRLNVISSFVSQLYTAVKSENNDCVFSISPAGNINNNYEQEYADVKLWCSQRGYCDWIIPQLYYGFENELLPFDEACKAWEKLDTVGAVRMLYGIAAYKLDESDEEFNVGNGIIEKEISAAKSTSNYGGVVFFSYSALADESKRSEFESVKLSVFSQAAAEEG